MYERILITGANGLLGQHLVRLMSPVPDYDVLATGRNAQLNVQNASCGYTQLDITNHDDAKRLFTDFAPSVVINCAAMTQVDLCETNRDACWQVNVDAVANLASLSKSIGSRLIQVSTDFIFDGDAGPYRESDRPNPVNYYGKSKLAAENSIRKLGLKSWSIARTVLVYGTGRNLSRSNIVLWVVDQLKQGKEIRVVTDQWRSPTYVPDLAVGIEHIVRYRKDGVFHLSGRDFVSINEFAHKVAAAFGLDADLILPADRTQFSQEAERPPKTGFIILKAETELGYRPRTIEDALRHMAESVGSSTVPTS